MCSIQIVEEDMTSQDVFSERGAGVFRNDFQNRESSRLEAPWEYCDGYRLGETGEPVRVAP